MREKLTFDEFARRYCHRQTNTPYAMLKVLRRQFEQWGVEGWFLAECRVIDSAAYGALTVVPYGPRNTFRAIPDGKFSTTGLASDSAVAVAYCLASELPSEAAPWEPPGGEASGERNN